MNAAARRSRNVRITIAAIESFGAFVGTLLVLFALPLWVYLGCPL